MQESVTNYTYWNNTLLPLTVTQTNGAGTLSAVTTYSYDTAGRVTMADGPLSGTNDAVYYRYDAAGRRTWEIGAVNQAGLRVAKRYTYRDADDQVALIETGTLTSPTDTNLIVETRDRKLYDSIGRLVKTQRESTIETLQVSQIAYDGRNRAICSTTRMNPATFAALPASACSLGTSGEFGEDRIVKTDYDAVDHVIKTTEAVGTLAEGIDREASYTPTKGVNV